MDGQIESKDDRRKGLRISVELNALLRVSGGGDDTIYQAVTKDISRGGVSLEIRRGTGDLPGRLKAPETRISIAFELRRASGEVRAYASPAWIRTETDWIETPRQEEEPLQVGLIFVDFRDGSLEEIDRFIKERAGS